MIETSHSGSATQPPPGMRRESGGEDYRTILLTAACLVATCVVVLLVTAWMLRFFWQREEADRRATFPLAAQENQAPLDQRLRQVSKSGPLVEGLLRAAPPSKSPQQELLEAFGPSPDKGFARIPIELAMERMLEKHRFPVQPLPEPKPPKKEERP